MIDVIAGGAGPRDVSPPFNWRGVVAPPHGPGLRQILKPSAELQKLLKGKGKKMAV